MSYAQPEVLVNTEWVHEHLNDPKTRIVEVDYDPTAHNQLGHIPGAVLFDSRKDLTHPLTKDTPQYARATFKASKPDESIRVYLRQALDLYNKPGVKLVDVRSPKEYTGEILAPPEYPTEHAQRGGHIPGAVNIPWSQAVNADGVFKPYDEIKRLYEAQGVTADKDVIAYCR